MNMFTGPIAGYEKCTFYLCPTTFSQPCYLNKFTSMNYPEYSTKNIFNRKCIIHISEDHGKFSHFEVVTLIDVTLKEHAANSVKPVCQHCYSLLVIVNKDTL